MSQSNKYNLPADVKVPNHIAIIPDGNRRWARARNKPTLIGHSKGFDVATEVIKAARDMGVHTVTLWAFSTSNWDRTKQEISYLMRLYAKMIDDNLQQAIKDKVRIIHLGRKDRIPKYLLDKIKDAEIRTKDYSKHVLNIALDYGGHDDVIRNLNDKNLDRPISEEKLAINLDTDGQPYPNPDLIIRTSGEQRTSGLMCWQADQAELQFVRGHFPELTPDALRMIIIDFSRRRRRFGGNDQVLHLNFRPERVAKNEIMAWQAHHESKIAKAAELTAKVMRELFALDGDAEKEIRLSAEVMFNSHDTRNIKAIISAMSKVYHVIKKVTGFAFDPDWVAQLEADWMVLHDKLENDPDKEELVKTITELFAESYRINRFQAEEAARLRVLAFTYHDLAEKVGIARDEAKYWWNKAENALVRSYTSLKNMVA